MNEPNTTFGADVVIKKTLAGWAVFVNDDVVASVNEQGLRLMVAGAVSRQLSVYDASERRFITGTLDQIEG